MANQRSVDFTQDNTRQNKIKFSSSRENACALTHIEEALMWMNRRVEDRIERNVLGKNEK